MGLREALRQSLAPELHGCTPYAMQQCNSSPERATADATNVQLAGVSPGETDATADATAMQQASCMPVSPVQLQAAQLHPARLPPAQADECHAGGWTDAEIQTFSRRQTLMLARGFKPEHAEVIAEALTLRDHQGDDRRMCVECSYLGDRGRCLAASSGKLIGVDRRLEPVATILQRCEAFGLRKGLP